MFHIQSINQNVSYFTMKSSTKGFLIMFTAMFFFLKTNCPFSLNVRMWIPCNLYTHLFGYLIKWQQFNTALIIIMATVCLQQERSSFKKKRMIKLFLTLSCVDFLIEIRHNVDIIRNCFYTETKLTHSAGWLFHLFLVNLHKKTQMQFSCLKEVGFCKVHSEKAVGADMPSMLSLPQQWRTYTCRVSHSKHTNT